MRLPFSISSLLLVFSFANASPLALAQEHWVSLATPNFEMYTTNPENEALQELEFFEGVRSCLLKTIPLKTSEDAAVQIVAFQSESEYSPYRFQAGGSAYYLNTFDGDYIVLEDINPRHRQLVAHEFTHVMVRHAGLTIPIWLNEGLAELYSSIEPLGEQVIVGRPPSQHLATLGHHPWIDWSLLFAVDRDSPYYNEGNKMSIFYAQSWALTHMLALSQGYAPRFHQFLAAVSGGQGSAEALQSIYGKNIAVVEADLKIYIRQKPLPEQVFDTPLRTSSIQPIIGQPSDFQLNFALATLLSGKPSTLAEAQAKLAALSAQYPENPEPEESLGYLALQQNRTEEARSHFAIAVQRHSRNPEIIYRYAELQQDAGAKDADVMALLEQALALKPDAEDVRVDLGLLAARDFQSELALSLLSILKAVPSGQAYAVYSAMARCNLDLKRPKTAKTYAEKAKAAAKDETEKQDADDLLREIVSADEDAVEESAPVPTRF